MAGNFSFRGKGLRFPNGIPRTTAESGNNANGLRTRIAAAIAQADGDLPGMEPASCDYEMADAVIDVLIDMAGHGELLKAIDGMYRQPRSAEKLGLTGDGE